MPLRLLLILLILVCNTQLSARQNYIQYHKDIIGAERLFLTNRFDSSLKAYKKIFTEYSKPFAKDCFTALQIACIANDTTRAKHFFDLCFKRGVGWNTIMAVGHIKNMLAQDNMRRYAKDSYARGQKQYYTSIDTVLRNYILSLVAKDFKYHPKNDLSAERSALYAKAMDEIIVDLNAFCTKHGFPGESLIGIQDADPAQDKIVRLYLSIIPANIFFHHHCGYILMKELLLKALRDGELQPKEYALIYEWSYATMYTKRTLQINKEKWGKYAKRFVAANLNYSITCHHPQQDKFYNIYIAPTYYCNDTLLVNNDRAEIGISTLQHDAAKQFFAKKHNLILFYGLFARY